MVALSWWFAVLCLPSLGEVGLSVLFVADGRGLSLQRATAQPSCSPACPLEAHFSSCRASCGEDDAKLGFSSWSGAGSSQGSRARSVAQRPSWWPLLPHLSVFPSSASHAFACSPSPPSTSSPVASTSLSSPAAPGGIMLAPCGVGSVWLWGSRIPRAAVVGAAGLGSGTASFGFCY